MSNANSNTASSKKHIRKTSEDNETLNEYYASPAKDKKVQLSSTIIACFVTLVIGVVVGLNWNGIAAQLGIGGKKADISKIDFDSLNDVYMSLAENYDGELDKTKIIEEAKRGLVNAAGDKYTYYMTTEEAEKFKKDLEGDVGAGIGVEIGERDGFVKVLRTTEGNPARKAGVLAGDIIYKADGEDISALSVEDVAKKLRGEAGTTVVLTVVRNNEEKEFTLVRETINNASVYVNYRNGGKTAVLTISRFDSDTGKLAEEKAKEILEKGCTKLIVDLRGNGGGYVNAAKDVASLWIDGDVVVEQRSANGEYNEKTYANSGKAILKDMKTILLVNGSTASASEILTGALHDYGKATIIGEKTYGKGCVQALENFMDGSVLRVTIAKWYTPHGNNIHEEGIEPDKVVERTFEQINKDVDPQLDAALTY